MGLLLVLLGLLRLGLLVLLFIGIKNLGLVFLLEKEIILLRNISPASALYPCLFVQAQRPREQHAVCTRVSTMVPELQPPKPLPASRLLNYLFEEYSCLLSRSLPDESNFMPAQIPGI